MDNIKPDKTICELFAGVGGFRLGFERLNSGWKTVWFSQWEPSHKTQWAHDCYIEHFGDAEDMNGDFTTNDDISIVKKYTIPDHTLLVGGFPCQDYSVAQSLSSSKGIEGKKGVLWWQIRDVIESKQPLFCIFENVDRLISSPSQQRGRDFGIILGCFNKLGYSVEWRVVNAAMYGGPQKRRRTFIFAYKNNSVYGTNMATQIPIDIIHKIGFMATSFPVVSVSHYKQTSMPDDILEISNTFEFGFLNAGYMHDGIIHTAKIQEDVQKAVPLKDILQSAVDEEYYLSENRIDKFRYLKGKKSIPRVSKSGFEYVFSEGSIPFPDLLTEPSRTLLTSEGVTSRTTHVVNDPETDRLRVLTPVETERLQNFDDDWTNTGMPNRTRYFCMGNALVISMVTRMGKTLDDIMDREIKMEVDNRKKSFMYDYQMDAVDNMRNGCILNGGVGSGKSRTALYYYFKEQGGYIVDNMYKPMVNPKDLYIITTARKRDTLEWEGELAPFLMNTDPELSRYKHKIIIDSWNNISKYADVKDAFFILDEQRLVSYGAWTKSFLKIANNNQWILLSATPGDTWSDYMPVFIANGFYRNKSEFIREHIIYSRYTKFPKIDRYVNTGRLIRLRDRILVDMDFHRKTRSHHEDIYCTYDILTYKDLIRNRWNIYENEPIRNASELCYLMRKVVNSDESRQVALLELLEKHPRAIIFYNFDYELDILKGLYYGEDVEVAEWNGHKHQPIPTSGKWVYLVQYTAGCEGWNCVTTDTIIFYSQNYSYKVIQQACGRIDRLNTPFMDLYYYHLKSRSGIDLAISKALTNKKKFNERKFTKWE